MLSYVPTWCSPFSTNDSDVPASLTAYDINEWVQIALAGASDQNAHVTFFSPTSALSSHATRVMKKKIRCLMFVSEKCNRLARTVDDLPDCGFVIDRF